MFLFLLFFSFATLQFFLITKKCKAFTCKCCNCGAAHILQLLNHYFLLATLFCFVFYFWLTSTHLEENVMCSKKREKSQTMEREIQNWESGEQWIKCQSVPHTHSLTLAAVTRHICICTCTQIYFVYSVDSFEFFTYHQQKVMGNRQKRRETRNATHAKEWKMIFFYRAKFTFLFT